MKDIERAMDVCSLHSDHDFKYVCAAGVIMELGLTNGFDSNSHEPCDRISKFPAACYRFKSDYFKSFKGNYPCESVQDEYHLRACLFGEGYTASTRNICWKYNPNHNPKLLKEKYAWDHFSSCMDGTWQSTSDLSKEACYSFEGDPTMDACEFRFKNNAKWNWELLEEM